jgi:dihydrofolate reductase
VAKLIYFAVISLDGYIEDQSGSIDWSDPGEEVLGFINDKQRAFGTQLYGRRVYETMVVWETMDTGPAQRAATREYAKIWRATDKVVYSTTLDTVSSGRTRLERTFDPGDVREMKERGEADLVMGGSVLAAQAFRSGLVDELQLFFAPVLLGGGKRAFPEGVHMRLRLEEERRFASGFAFLRYGLAA